MNDAVKIFGGLALLVYGISRIKNGIKVRVDGYSFNAINLSDGLISLNINLAIKNPLLFGVTIKGIVGDIYAQGVKVGYVNTAYNYYLAGGKTHIIPIVVNLHMAEVGNAALLNIQSGSVDNMTISFNGKVLISNNKIAVPVQLDLAWKDIIR